jgi:carbamoyltransferase
MSTVVGIHDGHNASVAVVRDGKVEFALQEERLTRVKNQGDAPVCAAREARRLGTVVSDAANPVRIALNGRYINYNQWQRETILRDYEQSAGLASQIKQPLKNTFIDHAYQRLKCQARMEELSKLGWSSPKPEPVDHHLAHASAAYYTSPWTDRKTLVLTCDGSGDRLSASASIGDRGKLTRIAEISEHDSIGRLYALVTRILGMAPLEHEYKVMGLAPYVANSEKAAQAGAQFLSLFEFTRNGMVWRRKNGVPSMYAAYGMLRTMLQNQRFDYIAAGAQSFVEQMLTTWVRNAIRETGISRLACSGGVFMNVKANLAVLELPEVEEMYVFPSCGDESNSIGAACFLAAQSGEKIQPLGPIYYGEPISDSDAESALRPEETSGKLRCRYVEKTEALVAETLAAGKIVARASGANEFGARALGNRSILARADSPHAVRTINEMVKNRDFWMPFAPSVLAERAADYYEKPKPVTSAYMMFAFRSKKERRSAFPTAQHPYDFTTRPHEVTEEHNPGYYRLLKEYESRTGEGILLNTSFNLHGEPIVYTARDAVDVFLRSGLEYMALGNWWVEKKNGR